MEHAAAVPLWIVAVSIDAHVTLPGGGVVARDDFLAWIWERADGLVGIDEGSVTAADAAARGLVPSWLVIDAAAAPADRDWVSGLTVAEVEWCFPDEASARRAADLVADVTGCRIRGIRAEAAVDHEALARAAFPPIAVAGFGTVLPAWEAGAAGIAADGEALIFIEPGLGFGTGLHATTQLCMTALAERRRRGDRLDRVLDFGSGSGILSIAAAVLGAARVDAVEIDSGVHDALRTNAGRNGVANRLRLAADLSSATGPYDVVVANIVAPVLLECATDLCARLARPGAELILSGVLAAEAPAVANCYADRLAARPHVEEREGWCCLSFRPG